MRFSICLLIALFGTTVSAQPVPGSQPVAPSILTGMPAAQPAQPGITAQQPTTMVVPLSEAAKPAPIQPAPKIGVIQPEANAITVVDGNGARIDAAAARLAKKQSGDRLTSDVALMRISNIGGERHAVLWVAGGNRIVKVGSQVLKYVVSEFRDDGVCLDKEKGKAKCARFITFETGR